MKYCFSFIFFFCCVVHFNAQNYTSTTVLSPEYEGKMNPDTPDVASLGQFGGEQVNLYNGRATIGIPIHTISFGKINIPITLSYTTSGIRAAQEATCVGLGWALSGEAVISNEIHGYDDTKNNITPSGGFTGQPKGYIYTPTYLSRNAPFFNLEMTDQALDELVQGNQAGAPFDTEPDIFTISLFGREIKFAMEKLEESATIANGVALGTYNTTILFDTVTRNFSVTDEHGYVYEFNEKELSTPYFFHSLDYGGTFTREDHLRQAHYSSNNWNNHDIMGDIISWKISKITDPFGNEIQFNYTRSLVTTFPSIADQKSYALDNVSGSGSIPRIYDIGPGVEHTVRIYTQEVANLNSITGDFGEITMNLGSRKDLFSKQQYEDWANSIFHFKWTPNTEDAPYKVDGITVKNYRNEIIKEVSFDYSYFNDQYEDQSGQQEFLRLKLDEVTINDKKHAFSYLNENSLPSKATADIDFWGFYNGAGNTNTVPDYGRYNLNFAFCAGGCPIEGYYQYRPSDTRKSNFDVGKYGLLETITYPTGGKTEFIYEGNQVSIEQPSYHTPYIYDDDKLGSAGIINSQDYNWAYQYLKMANDSNYTYVDYMSTCQTEMEVYGNNNNFSITTTNTCDRDYNVIVKSVLSCATGCDLNVSPSGPATWIRNTDTNAIINIFDFDYHATPGSYWTVCLDEELLLPVGNYRFEYDPSWQQVINGTTYIAANNSNLRVFEGTDTGGSQETSYEQFEVGGARVKAVVEMDTDNAIISKKQIHYNEIKSDGQELSSGILMDDLVFHSKNKGYFEYTPEYYYNNTINLHSNNVLRGHNAASGSHIGYSTVREEYVDTTNELINGYTIKTFVNVPNSYTTRDIGNVPVSIGTDPDDPSDDGPVVSYGEVYILNAPPKTNTYKNGSILKNEAYTTTGERVAETSYNYIERSKGSYIPGGFPYPLISYQFFLLSNCNTAICGFFPYLPYYHTISMSDVQEQKLWLLSNTETTQYFNGEAISVSKDYEYSPFHPSPIVIQETREAGDILKTYQVYPQNIDNPSANILSNEHRYSQMLQSSAELLKSNGTTVDLNHSIMEFANHSSVSASMPASYTSSQKGASDELYYTYEKYDARGNLLELIRDGSISVSFIYNNHDLLLARIENASYDQIEALPTFGSNFDITDTLTTAQEASLRSLEKAYITTYAYTPLVGVTSVTDPRGYTMFYTYDAFNRLEYVKDQNGKVYSKNEYNYSTNN